jgi:hypothetical protein
MYFKRGINIIKKAILKNIKIISKSNIINKSNKFNSQEINLTKSKSNYKIYINQNI